MLELSNARMTEINGGEIDLLDFACGFAIVGEIALFSISPIAFGFFAGKTFALCAMAAIT